MSKKLNVNIDELAKEFGKFISEDDAAWKYPEAFMTFYAAEVNRIGLERQNNLLEEIRDQLYE